MAYYIKEKLAELAVARAQRTEYVREAQRAAADNIYLVQRIVRRALPLAHDEGRDFFITFGEPLPAHAQRSLDAEIAMWERLDAGLTSLHGAEITDEGLAQYTRRVRKYLGCTEDLLRLQTELVTSCLVRHYEQQRERILAAAASYDISTFTR